MIAHAKKSLALAALLASTSALAAAPDWRVSEVSGSVTVDRGGTVLSVRQDTTLQPGDVIRTGRKGRAVLVRGKEFVVVSPGAQLKVAVPQESGPVVQFFQYLGNALFKIEKKSTPHFGVKTPYLAAVVKGTTFNVSVGADRSSVQVTEGAVEVATGDDLEAALITPGLIGFVDADDAGELMVIAGSRAGEDLSGAIVRGTPEFVNTPPQANGDAGDAPGASGMTPAAERSNRVLSENLALASAGKQLALNLMDDDVSGGASDGNSDQGGAELDQDQPDALYDDAGESDTGSNETQEAAAAVEPVAEPDDSSQQQEVAPEPEPIEPVAAANEGPDQVAADAPAGSGEEDGSGVEEDIDDGNNGHGNDDDSDDDGNPGQGSGNGGIAGGNDELGGSGVDDNINAGGSGYEVAEIAAGAVGSSSGGNGVFGGGFAAGANVEGSPEDGGSDVDIDFGQTGSGSNSDLVYAEDQQNGSCAGVANCSGGAKPDDVAADIAVDLGLASGGDQDDGNNGEGTDSDGSDSSNTGDSSRIGNGNSGGDELDGSGVEEGLHAGNLGDANDIAIDELETDGDEGASSGLCLGNFCFDLRGDDDEDGRDENDDGDGRACGRIICIEGPGIDEDEGDDGEDGTRDDDDIDVGDDLELDLDDDDGNNGHGNDDDDDDSNPGKGKGGKGGGKGDD